MYIGIDIGTSSVKSTVIDSHAHIIYEDKEAYPMSINGLEAEQNPIDWFNATLKVLKNIPNVYKAQVKKIGFSGQMHSLVVLDKDGDVIRPAILWNDQRTYNEVQLLLDHFGLDGITRLTSNIPLTGFTAPKLLWMKHNEKENFDKIHKILLPKDYIVYRLTEIYATDYSDASGTLMLDVENKKWSKEVIEYLGIKVSALPKLHDAKDVIGQMTKENVQLLGFQHPVDIMIGGSDQSIGALGALVIDKNEVSIAMGTSGVIYLNLDIYQDDPSQSLHVFANAIGGYHFMGVMLTCAQSLKWWQDITNEENIETLINRVENLENDVLFLPYLQGERTPINNPFAKAIFYGLTLNHTQKDMTLAILEGVGFALKDILNAMNESKISINKAYISGGGTKSSLWMQMISDILGIELIVSETSDTVSYGAALLGIIQDQGIEALAALKKSKNNGNYFKPNAAKLSYYSLKFQQFKLLYKYNVMSH
ncbi:xylulokinase [Acholeplasma laidlawii]|uniref:xylulokinase n=1 Tax=Acholeplasma laidlawii TaxID=2148 RepID=UPI0021F771C2|nr:xylulokinase [Acholeplasma laidlawii]